MEICYYGGGGLEFLCNEPLNCVMVWHEQLAGIMKDGKGGGCRQGGINPNMLKGL